MKNFLKFRLNLGGGDWCPKCKTYGFVDDSCVNCGYYSGPGKI